MMDRGLHKQGNPSCAARRVESKNLKERSCTSASSAERIGAFGYSVSLGAGRLAYMEKMSKEEDEKFHIELLPSGSPR
jgi:hypothetical protein